MTDTGRQEVGIADGPIRVLIVGEAGDGEEAVAAVAELDPDVVLMDPLAAAEIGGSSFPGNRRRPPGSPRLVLLTGGLDIAARFKGCDSDSLLEFVQTSGGPHTAEVSTRRTPCKNRKG